MPNKKISELNTATLPLSGTEEIAIVQDGETKKIAILEVAGGGANSFVISNIISQNLAASNNWYGWGTFGGSAYTTLTAIGGITPVNDFAGFNQQTPSLQVPNNCKIKSITMKGGTNTSSTNIRVCFIKSKGVSGVTIANSKIIADKTFSTAASFNVTWLDAELDLITELEQGSEIRIAIFNNNVNSHVFSGYYALEFEEVI